MHIGFHHFVHEFGKPCLVLPAEDFARLRWVAMQCRHFCRTEIPGVDAHENVAASGIDAAF